MHLRLFLRVEMVDELVALVHDLDELLEEDGLARALLLRLAPVLDRHAHVQLVVEHGVPPLQVALFLTARRIKQKN